MSRRTFIGFFLAIAVVLPCVAMSTGSARAQLPEFNPQVVIPRAMPAIENAPVISAARADRQLQDSELVLGITVKGQSRAYPINMLTGPRREIINDTLGGRSIAATW